MSEVSRSPEGRATVPEKARARKPLTVEHMRILLAAHEKRLVTNGLGRWIINGHSRRPDPRARKQLLERGYMDRNSLKVTELGRQTLEAEGHRLV